MFDIRSFAFVLISATLYSRGKTGIAMKAHDVIDFCSTNVGDMYFIVVSKRLIRLSYSVVIT